MFFVLCSLICLLFIKHFNWKCCCLWWLFHFFLIFAGILAWITINFLTGTLIIYFIFLLPPLRKKYFISWNVFFTKCSSFCFFSVACWGSHFHIHLHTVARNPWNINHSWFSRNKICKPLYWHLVIWHRCWQSFSSEGHVILVK